MYFNSKVLIFADCLTKNFYDMPKMKTKSGAKKRFKLTGSGNVKFKHAFKSHILTKKTTKQKRNLTHTAVAADSNERMMKSQLH